MRFSFSRFVTVVICLYVFKCVVSYMIFAFQTDIFPQVVKKNVGIGYQLQYLEKDFKDSKRNAPLMLESLADRGNKIPGNEQKNNVRSYFLGMNTPDDILQMERPEYLKNFKNPCWYEGATGNSTLKCLPYFRIIGVDKCGTTDLWYRLTKHPEIVKPIKAVIGKETHWWSWRRFGFDIWVRNKPIRHFDWYLSIFDDPALKIEKNVVTRNGSISFHPLVTGEGSPTEFWDFTGWNLIPQNADKSPSDAVLTPHCLHHVTPNLKSIVIFRNPSDRAFSDYLFLDKFRPVANLSAAGFHRDVVVSIKMLEECIKSHSMYYCLYDKDLHIKMPVRLIPGMYDMFLSKWLEAFPAENILVLRNEDYSKDIQTHLKNIFDFLQLTPLSGNEIAQISNLPRAFEKSGRAKSVGSMLKETRELLDKFYKPYNQMLATRMDDSNYLWNS